MEQKYIKEGIYHFLWSLILGWIIGTWVVTFIPSEIEMHNILLKSISELSLLVWVALNSFSIKKKNNVDKSKIIWLSLVLYLLFTVVYFIIFWGSLVIEFIYMAIISILYRYIGYLCIK